MAVKFDNANQIITMTATNDEVDGLLDVQGIMIEGTAAGVTTIYDGHGNTLATINLTTSVLSFYLPLNRQVDGIVANTIATNQKAMIYLKKS